MERSGWDDDERGALPPPSQRAWRHPSELGNHGAMAGAPRRATRGQFALAVAAGAVGSLAVATLAVVVTGGQARTTSVGAARNDITGGVALTAQRTTLLSSSVADPVEPADSVATTVSVDLATTAVALAVPSVVSLRRSATDAGSTGEAGDRDIAAVVIDDTTLLAEPDDVAGVERFEAALPDGSTVSVTVDGTDPSSGLVRLRTRGSLAVSGADSGTWLGVRCSDEPGEATVTTTTDTAHVPTEPATTAPGGGSLAPASRSLSTAGGATATAVATTGAPIATAPATAVLGRSGTTLAAATTVPSASVVPAVTANTTAPARPPTASSAPASTATTAVADDARPTGPAPPVAVSASPTSARLPSTASPTVAPPMSLPAPVGARVVHVRDVVDGSPADVAGLQPGDLIISIDGRPVHSMWSLVLAVRRHAIGESITVEIRRAGATVLLPVVLSHHPGTGT